MKMYLKSFVFLFLVLSLRTAFSQETPDTRKCETLRKDTIINLLKEYDIGDNKIVTLFKNDNVIVETKLDFFKFNLNQLLMSYHDKSDSIWQKVVTSEKIGETEVSSLIEKYYKNSQRLERLTAQIIDTGECWVIDRRTGLFYDEVEIQYFDYYRNEKAGYGGRQYLIWGNNFLRVIDYVI